MGIFIRKIIDQEIVLETAPRSTSDTRHKYDTYNMRHVPPVLTLLHINTYILSINILKLIAYRSTLFI